MTANLDTDLAPRRRAAGGVTERLADRRRRRRARYTTARLSAAGRAADTAPLRVPLVVALIVLLAIGVGGVLYFNTKTDALGIRTEQAKSASDDLRLEIESLNRAIAQQESTPRLAQQAKEMGLVPAGDATIIVIGADGRATVAAEPDQAADPQAAE